MENTDAVDRTNLKRTLSCSLDSSAIGSPLSSPKCVTSLNNTKQFTEFNASSTFSGSLLSPSSSSDILVSSLHVTTYSSSPMPVSNSYTALPTSTLNSPSAVFSSCMFPEIPAFSPSDSALSSCGTSHAPASDSAFVGCSAAELTAGGVNEGGVAENSDEGCGSLTSTLKRSLSGTFSDDDVMTRHASKRTCSDNHQQTAERSTGSMTSSTLLI